MFGLAEIALVLPVSTAQAERAFSQQNLIKTKLRNSLKEEHLAALLRISLDGPDTDVFEFLDAVQQWKP